MRPGRVLGIAGGGIAVAASVLPWAAVSGPSAAPAAFSGLTVGPGGELVFLSGLLGLVCVAIPRKVTALLGLAWGVAALVLGLITLAGIDALASRYAGSVVVTTEYGVYLALLGSVLLIVGSGIARREAIRAAVGTAPPTAETAPPPG